VNDDGTDIRLLLQGVLTGLEPVHRDLAGPAVSVVLNGRKRMRTLTCAASMAAVVAVAGVAMTIGHGGARKATAGGIAATSPPSATTSGATGKSESTAWDKDQDILDRLPGLVNAVLPRGYSMGATDGELNGPSFRLTGPTGTNSVSITAMPAADVVPQALPGPDNCVANGGRCSSQDVPGGTLYLQLKDFPADYGGAGGFKPGTEKTILSFDDEYTFVPSSTAGYSYTIRMSAGQAHAQYADKPPKGWTGGTWPPSGDVGNLETAFNVGGALLSQDQFVAMVGSPGMTAVGTLLDRKTPAAQAAIDERRRADAAIQAATKDLLPSGTTLSIDADNQLGMGDLLLTGPSGTNTYNWQASRQLPTWLHGWACETHTQKNCTATDVPGGELAVTSPVTIVVGDDQQASWYQPGTTKESAYVDVMYQYLPDDRNGTVVSVTLRAQIKDIPWASTQPKNWRGSGTWPPAARTGEPFNAGGALLTPEQFMTLARSPDLMKTVTTVNGFLHFPFSQR
jgi:hypothetical protein